MSDRQVWQRPPQSTTARLRAIAGHVDRFCDRINDGLAVVALMLAVVVVASLVLRVPYLLAQGLAVETDPTAASDGSRTD